MAEGQAAEAPKVEAEQPTEAQPQDSKKSFGGPRKRLMWGRIFLGQVVDWKGKYGWIQPAEPILHFKANLRQGRIFVSRTDLVGSRDLLPGVMVQFQVYEDDSGLGAQSCTVWNPMMPFKGGWQPGKGSGKKTKSKEKDSKEGVEEAKSSASPGGPGSPGTEAPGAPPVTAAPVAKATQPKAKAGKSAGPGEAKGKGKGGRGKDPAKKGEGGGKAHARDKGGKSREKGGKGKDEKGKGRGANDRNAAGRHDRPAGMAGVSGLGQTPSLAGYPGRATALTQSPGSCAVPGSACGLASPALHNLPKPASAQVPRPQMQQPLQRISRELGMPVPGFEASSLDATPPLQNLPGLQLGGLPGLQGLQQSLGLGHPWSSGFPQIGPGAGLGGLGAPYPDLHDLHNLRSDTSSAHAAQLPFGGGLAGTSFLT